MVSNKMQEMTWLMFDQRRKETDLVILPAGACEVYGPHLPMGSDAIVAEEVACRVAERVNAVVAPTIPMGESFGLGEYPGTIVIGTESFSKYCEDIIKSLIRWGFKRFVFLDGHAGNVPIISRLAREYQTSHGIKCMQIDWWRFVQPLSADILDNKGYMAHGHASECGTSVLLYLRPDLIDKDKIGIHPPRKIENYTEWTDIIKYPSFLSLTDESGSVGDSTCASVEKGEKIVEAAVNRICDYIEKEF